MATDAASVLLALGPAAISALTGVFAARYGAHTAIKTQVVTQDLIAKRARDDKAKLAEKTRALFLSRLADLSANTISRATYPRDGFDPIISSLAALRELHRDNQIVLELEVIEQAAVATAITVATGALVSLVAIVDVQTVNVASARKELLFEIYQATNVAIGFLGLTPDMSRPTNFDLAEK